MYFLAHKFFRNLPFFLDLSSFKCTNWRDTTLLFDEDFERVVLYISAGSFVITTIKGLAVDHINSMVNNITSAEV